MSGGIKVSGSTGGPPVVFGGSPKTSCTECEASLIGSAASPVVRNVLGGPPKTTGRRPVLPGVGSTLLFLLVILHFSSASIAGLSETIPTRDKSGVQINISQCFDEQPKCGYAPVRIKITNDTASVHSWNFSFRSPGNDFGNSNTNSIEFEKSFTVPPTEERIFEVLVPLALIPPSQYSNGTILVRVDGYGAQPTPTTLSSKSGGRANSSISVGYSSFLDQKSGTEIRKKFDSGGSANVFNTAIDFNQLPADWRALAGFDAIWITEKEWSSLPAATRVAVEQWIATGGILYRSTDAAEPSVQSKGFGEIRSFYLLNHETALANHGVDPNLMALENNKVGTGVAQELSQSYRNHWPEKTIVPPYKPNSVLLISIIALFGILVGPINFFLFARGEKRHRIFWTTPALSLGGALLVGLTILVQDGFNGWGRRLAVVHLLPEQNSEVVLQEQASRTGLLLGGEFSTDPTTLIQPISLDPRAQQFSTDGGHQSGQWFTSRRIQGQWLTAVRPSRAKIQLTNSSGLARGEAPKILSSISATLDDFYWVDSKLETWHVSNVGPGKTAVLARSNLADLRKSLALQKLPGPRLQSLLKRMEEKPNTFYATGRAPQGAMLPSLHSIIWRDDRILYLGPVTL